MERSAHHLDSVELQNCLHGRLDEPAAKALIGHLAECRECSGLLSALLPEAEPGGVGGSTAEGTGCLSSFEIALLAEGLTDSGEVAVQLKHVAECAACRAEFRMALQSRLQDLDEEQERLVDSLVDPPPSASSGAQTTGRKGRLLQMPKPKHWLVGAAVAACVVAGFYVYREGDSTAALLAEAYTEQRTLDYRLPDAGYAPVRRQLGPSGPSWETNAPLLKAQQRLLGPDKRSGNEAELLHLTGIAALIRQQPDPALEALKQAAELLPDDLEAAVDLAVAYAARGDAEKHQSDYGRALEYLGRVLNKKENHARALFNRALVLERMTLLGDAAAAWREYLKRYPGDGWAKEAQEHLNDVERRLNQRGRKRDALTNPEIYASAKNDELPSPDLALEGAVFRWVVNAGAAGNKALARLTDELEHRGDLWLKRALASADTSDPDWSRVQTVVETNVAGNPDEALRLSEPLRAARSTPLRLRTQYERAYAFMRTTRPRECVAEAELLLESAAASDFRTLEMWTHQVHASCIAMLGHQFAGLDELEKARQQAQKQGLRGCALRLRSIRTGIKTNAGDPWIIWEEAQAMLGDYWTDAHAPNRLNQVTYDLSQSCEYMGFLDAAFQFRRMAVNAMAEAGNRTTEALARASLAGVALQSGRVREALAEAERSEQQFQKLSGSATAKLYAAEARLWAAEAELSTGRYAEANHRLQAASEVFGSEPTFLQALRLSELKARASFGQGDLVRAGNELEQTVRLVRTRLRSAEQTQTRQELLLYSLSAYSQMAELLIRRGQDRRALNLALELGALVAGRPAAESAAEPDAREIWLVLLPLRETLAVWRVDGHSVAFREVKLGRADFCRHVDRLLAIASAPNSQPGSVLSQGRRLFATLLGSWKVSGSGVERLSVLAHGYASKLSPALLVDETDRYLVSSVAVVRARALPVAMDSTGNWPAGSVLLAGNSTAVEAGAMRLPALPGATEELADIATRFERPVLLTDDDATPEALTEAGQRARLFHFVGHGYANAGHGALLVGGRRSATFGARAIRRARWDQCRLAVLASCLTAVGEFQDLPDPSSLVQAFLSAGVRAVIASAWSIDAAATKQWMRAFYQELLNGRDAAFAAHQAAKVVAANSRYGHPYYWASFAYYI